MAGPGETVPADTPPPAPRLKPTRRLEASALLARAACGLAGPRFGSLCTPALQTSDLSACAAPRCSCSESACANGRMCKWLLCRLCRANVVHWGQAAAPVTEGKRRLDATACLRRRHSHNSSHIARACHRTVTPQCKWQRLWPTHCKRAHWRAGSRLSSEGRVCSCEPVHVLQMLQRHCFEQSTATLVHKPRAAGVHCNREASTVTAEQQALLHIDRVPQAAAELHGSESLPELGSKPLADTGGDAPPAATPERPARTTHYFAGCFAGLARGFTGRCTHGAAPDARERNTLPRNSLTEGIPLSREADTVARCVRQPLRACASEGSGLAREPLRTENVKRRAKRCCGRSHVRAEL